MRKALSPVLEAALPANASAAFLKANSEAYEWLVSKISAMDWRKEPETLLRLVTAAAGFAAAFHAGRFADGAIENPAWEIGVELEHILTDGGSFAWPLSRKGTCRNVLHVASHMVDIAGHTRMLYHWVQNDRSSRHSLVLLNQGNMAIPLWLSDAIRNSGGCMASFPSGSRLFQKARWLREIAQKSADLVVLHHDGHDVVPTVAFASNDCPPVAVLNHADHQFWLGSSVSDMVINLRSAASEHTAARRFVLCNAVIPIPLAEPAGQVLRRDARQALGIQNDHLMLLSVGRSEKYRPCGPYDFVATAGRILDGQRSAHLYVVGESAAGIAPHLRCGIHERMHFVGAMKDPSLYRAAADIYLESFPFGSNTALLEAALSGLPAVPAYAPLFPLLVAGNDALNDVLPNPPSEHDYVKRVDMLMRQPENRVKLGETLRKRLLLDHVGEGWLNRLTAIYDKADGLSHTPRRIALSPCSTLDEDIGLSMWRVVADGRRYSMGLPRDSVGAVLRHSAFVARAVGDYTKARSNAWRAVQHNPRCRDSWRLLGVTLLGRAAKFIRRALPRT